MVGGLAEQKGFETLKIIAKEGMAEYVKYLFKTSGKFLAKEYQRLQLI